MADLGGRVEAAAWGLRVWGPTLAIKKKFYGYKPN